MLSFYVGKGTFFFNEALNLFDELSFLMNSYLVSFAHINLVMVVIIDKFSSLIS